MTGRGSIVISPDGRRWRAQRRYVERPVPKLRERFRRSRKEVDGEGTLARRPLATKPAGRRA